jgi:sterol 24-C-methyltransferase
MAPIALEKEDHARDADFNKALHGKSAADAGGIKAMLGKSTDAQKAAVSEYFKHWDNKSAKVETDETRKARRDEYATLTRQYVFHVLSNIPWLIRIEQLLQSRN